MRVNGLSKLFYLLLFLTLSSCAAHNPECWWGNQLTNEECPTEE